MHLKTLCFTITSLVLLAACKSDETKTTTPPSTGPAANLPATIQVRMKTSKGDILLELNREKAPITVENFLRYVKENHYSGTVFHRVIDGFMIQGGGFSLKDGTLTEKPTGQGIQNEGRNGLKNVRGSIAMARTSDPNSATAQFFINVADNRMLDFPNNGGYAVFGKVTEGMDIVDQIKSTPTTTANLSMLHPSTGQKIEAPAGDVPSSPILIESVTIIEP